MISGQRRYILRRERSGGMLFDRQTGTVERIGEGHYILLERAHNLGTGASGVRKFLFESFADERNAEAFLGDCVRRGILEEEKASRLHIVASPLPPERLPIECNSAPDRLYMCLSGGCLEGDVKSEEDIELENANRILKKAAAAGTFEVWFFGGEPTLHPSFPAIINAAKETGLFVTVETYAPFDEHQRNKMLDSLVDRFAIIVAGTASVHDTLFGEGSYRKMVGFISRLAQRGEKILTLVMPLGKSNLENLKDAVGMAKAIRSEELLVIPARGKEAVSFETFSSRLNEAAALAENLGVVISSPCDLAMAENVRIAGCPAGISEAFLDHTGGHRACRYCDIGSKAPGDINELGYQSLWLDTGLFAAYRTGTPGCIAGRNLFSQK
jgi:MoaA/NifB/PqqE/SkfB family radical SAM enzyme